MSSLTTWPSLKRQRSESAGDAIALDYRERRTLEALEREAVKHQHQAEQYSSHNSADTRIRAWEKVHQLRMPASPLHPVLEAIAAATQLTLAEVRNEQRLRFGRRASADL